MGLRRNAAIIAASGLAAAILAPAVANATGRCGGSLVIDAPVSLSEIARRCNVRLSELREANLGVDPARVAPGAHLAIPDEVDGVAPEADRFDEVATQTTQTDDAAYAIAQRNVSARISTRQRLRDVHYASLDPIWMREATAGGNRSYAANRLSFQQRSAVRIHNAGVPTFDAPRIAPLRRSTKDAATKLIACSRIDDQTQSKKQKVKKIISTPLNTYVEVETTPAGQTFCTLVTGADTQTPASTSSTPLPHYGLPTVLGAPAGDGASYRLPDYRTINPGSDDVAKTIALRGTVTGERDGCLLMEGDNGVDWSLAATPEARDLIGKHVTAWGHVSRSGVCGPNATLTLSHAVYAERL
ncbi:MAG: LysM peptidoglycan-binding domain-containing protein [Pseudomonadota bacterium]